MKNTKPKKVKQPPQIPETWPAGHTKGRMDMPAIDKNRKTTK